ncbi:hypothetical protein [Geomonas edaphica]|uniref:hypothetical protein n=1 Tax=Geomonas edaphica TaxID=2570226 RepID=UPI0010A8467E|nr:hypothetical protein [Geomonas edaphica]
MKRTLIALILAAALPLSAYAAEFKIHETETAIVVEYTGEPENKAMAKPVEAAPVDAKPVPAQSASTSKTSSADKVAAAKAKARTALQEQAQTRSAARAARAAQWVKMNSTAPPPAPKDYYRAQEYPDQY